EDAAIRFSETKLAVLVGSPALHGPIGDEDAREVDASNDVHDLSAVRTAAIARNGVPVVALLDARPQIAVSAFRLLARIEAGIEVRLIPVVAFLGGLGDLVTAPWAAVGPCLGVGTAVRIRFNSVGFVRRIQRRGCVRFS